MRLPSFPDVRLPTLRLPTLRLRRTRADALTLVRALPLRKSAWLTARLGPLPRIAPPVRCWVELRGDVVVVYAAADILTSHRALRASDAGPLPHAADRLAELEAMEDGYTAARAAQLTTARVASFVLPATTVVAREDEAVIVLRARGELAGAALYFGDFEQAADWRAALCATISRRAKNLSDFEVLRAIGKGASGRVYLVEDKDTRERLALKVIEKSSVYQSSDSYRHALDERLVLQMAKEHPYILEMRYAFQNARRLFLITEFCPGGDLFDCMDRRTCPMDEDMARHVAAEILLALEHIHKLGIVYRDLKLENILLDGEGHIRIADFGLSKILKKENGRFVPTATFCGTKEYVAPEMLRGNLYDTTLDLWSFGILLYELVTGKTPFYSSDHNQIYKRIEKASIFYPHTMSPDLRNLLENLLIRDPSKRIGAGDGSLKDVMAHKWFQDVAWDDLVDSCRHESPLQRYCNGRTLLVNAANKQSRGLARRKPKPQKDLAALLADVEEDLQYVSAVRESTKSPTIALSRRPRSPMERRGGGILAGYSFCSPRSSPVMQLGMGGEYPSRETWDTLWAQTDTQSIYDHAVENSSNVSQSPIEASKHSDGLPLSDSPTSVVPPPNDLEIN